MHIVAKQYRKVGGKSDEFLTWQIEVTKLYNSVMNMLESICDGPMLVCIEKIIDAIQMGTKIMS